MSLLDIRKKRFGFVEPKLSLNVLCTQRDPINDLYEVADDDGQFIDDVAKYLDPCTTPYERAVLERNLGNMRPPLSHGFSSDDQVFESMIPGNLTENQLEDVVDSASQDNQNNSQDG